MSRPFNPDQPTNRSFRVRPGAWEKAKERAEAVGVTMSHVVGELVEGYAAGYYNLPTQRIVREFPQDPHNPVSE